MKKILPLMFLALLTGCISRIVTTYQSPESIIVSEGCNPLIVTEQDLFGLKVNYQGSILIDEPYSYINRSTCSKEAAFKRLKSDACNLKANLINITLEINPGEEIPPYHRSACYRCQADYYSLDFDYLSKKILENKNREIIYYTADKKLKWEDFKVELPESSETPYEFISTIMLRAGKVSVWTGAFKDFEANGAFYADVSKVKRPFANEANEKVIGLLFDMTQVHAKNLQQVLNSTKPRITDRKKIQDIVNDHNQELRKKIDKFNSETDYGNNTMAFEQWENRLQTEIINLGIKK